MKYPKIQTLWKRDKDNKFCIMPGECSDEAFTSICKWHVTEKIDGTNIRVFYENGNVRFGGRTDRVQTPQPLLDKLAELLPLNKFKKVFDEGPVILFGEGFGAHIQKGGGRYISDTVNFILFDVYVDGWWLNPNDVVDVAGVLGVQVVPYIGTMNTDQIVDYVTSGPLSYIAEDADLEMEGIVARSVPQLFNRKGERVMWKLKVKDYAQLESR